MTPSQKWNKPILGKITTKTSTWTIENMNTGKKEEKIIESEEYEVIIECDSFYVVDKWYKEHKEIPQLVPKEFVEEFQRY